MDTVICHVPFKVHIRQGSSLLPGGAQVPTEPSLDATTHDAPRWGKDTTIGTISQSIAIGIPLQALSGQLVMALSIPAEVGRNIKSWRCLKGVILRHSAFSRCVLWVYFVGWVRNKLIQLEPMALLATKPFMMYICKKTNLVLTAFSVHAGKQQLCCLPS